jgi:hypothetical protein
MASDQHPWFEILQDTAGARVRFANHFGVVILTASLLGGPLAHQVVSTAYLGLERRRKRSKVRWGVAGVNSSAGVHILPGHARSWYLLVGSSGITQLYISSRTDPFI